MPLRNGGTELVLWGWEILVIAVIFAALSLGLSAWPGKRAFWLGVTVMTVLTDVPASISTAVHLAQFFPHPAPASTLVGNYLLVHNWPELTAYDLLVLGVTAWVGLLYFPRLRGWRLAVFWTVTVVWCTALGFLFPVH
ncbi:MAG: hypothetical protein M0Z66_04805 [Thermaerobacter sp.]|nr:hypothetical protein [Thermaerobacter sp.]